MIIMASGSEVQLAVKARELLQAEGVGTGWYRSPRIRQPGTRNHSQELQMITDLSSQGARYAQIHPAFVDAFAFLNSTEPADLPAGSYDKGSFIAVVIETDGKGIQGAPLEYHQRKIDIHVTLTGHDSIGWCPKAQCATPAGPFDTDNDIGFFKDEPELWIPVPPGSFAVFFPEDAHAPLGGEGLVRKIVLKIVDVQP